jgi:N-acetylglucosamine-6-phosphate deacetylase
MPPVGGKRHTFLLQGRLIRTHDEKLMDEQGRLAGSLLDMASAVRNCMRLLGVSLPEALRMASTAPAKAIGLGDRLGRLMPSYRADLVAVDPATIHAVGTWVAGDGGLYAQS